MFCVVSWFAGDNNGFFNVRMLKIPVTAFAVAIHEPVAFQVADELTNFAGH
jgi:hypothetical protein